MVNNNANGENFAIIFIFAILFFLLFTYGIFFNRTCIAGITGSCNICPHMTIYEYWTKKE